MRPAEQDRAMRAVARVRGVRERDSRLGLLRAVASVREREQQVAVLRERLSDATRTEPGTLDQFATARYLLTGMAIAVRDAERAAAAARTVADEAEHRWQADSSRVAAVERLLEARALRRAEEAHRAEVRQIDDIVGSRHARTRTPAAGQRGA